MRVLLKPNRELQGHSSYVVVHISQKFILLEFGVPATEQAELKAIVDSTRADIVYLAGALPA